MNKTTSLLVPAILCTLFGCAGVDQPAPETGHSAVESDLSMLANAPLELKPSAKNVGILIFDGLFITELVAPFDIYKHTGDKMNVFTVGRSKAPIRTYYGVGLVPDFTIEDCPKIDVLVVPSGIHSVDTDLDDQALVGFIRERAKAAEWVTSHCWGAFKLAKAGLLDGKVCMTFPTSIEKLQKDFPGLKTKTGNRFLVDGKFVTSGGGLAAFEAAVWVVERMFGSELAQKVADGLVFADQNRAYSKNPVVDGGN